MAKRKLVLKMVLSLDGFATSLDGTHDWMFEFFGDDSGVARDDGTTVVHGGPTLAKSLTRLGLVDEYQLTWVPIAIGAGLSPFADLDEHVKLDVVDEQRFASGAHGQILVPKS